MPPRKRRTDSSIPPFEGEGTVIDTDVVAEIESSYLDYSYSVIYSRALPDARDGLKPVHRRILYSMAESGLRPDRPYVKSARVVGDVMGKYHPHGDSAIYDAMVRLAQPFAMRVPLVDGHGNWGSPDDGPAASRYCITGETRVRLADGSSPQIGDLLDLAPDAERELDLEVLDATGKVVRADRGFNSGLWPTLRVTTRSGFSLRGSKNHPLLCLITEGDGKPVLSWLRLDEITTGTVVCLARNAWEQVIPSLRDHATGLLLGAWASEGWASESRAGFNNCDKHFFDEVLEAYDLLVGGKRYVYDRLTKRSQRPIYEMDVQKGGMAAFAASPLAEFIGHKGADERVPEVVWKSGLGMKRAFLMATFEGDGGPRLARDGAFTVHYSTYSDGLARDLQELLLEFGVVASHNRYRRDSGKWEHRLVVSGLANMRAFAERVGFLATKQRVLRALLAAAPKQGHRLTKDFAPYVADYVRDNTAFDRRGSGRSWLTHNNFDRMDRWRDNRPEMVRRIKDLDLLAAVVPVMDSGYRFEEVVAVEDAGLAEVYSIRVATEDHSFLAGGFVNHNTECRLTRPALLLTDTLDEETVDLEDNYDGSLQQPVVLPAAFPNLLVNGTSGIAVGMATNMIPHNLVEVVDAAVHLLEHPDATLDDLMRHVPGPDLPTGGQLLGMTEVRAAYETGRGVVRMRATAELGTLPRGKSSITVTELPYGVGAERVTAKVSELVKSKKLQGVADINDYSDGSVGLELVIEVKAGFNAQALLGELYRLTPLEESFGINNVALVEGQPRTLGLKALLQVFLQHRVNVVTRRSRYRLRKAQERAHLLEGLLIALDHIDEVVRIIRGSADASAARAALIERFAMSDVQAGYVLDMQLRRLVALEVDRIRAELAELARTIAELERILADPVVLRGVIADELAEVAAEHGTPRRTVLVGGDLKALVTPRAASLEVADDPCVVLLSSAGLLARTPLVPASEGRASAKRHRHDVMLSEVRATARGAVGLLTSRGRVLRLSVLDLPEVPGVTTGALSLRGGASASEFAALERAERVLGLTTYDASSTGLALATRQGVVKRVSPEWPARLDTVDVIALRDDDEVVGAVELVDGEEELCLFTSTGDLLRFPASAVRPQGRSAGGMAGVKLTAGAFVVGFSAVALAGGETLFEEPVVITGAGLPPERGRGPGVVSSVKVTPLSDYPRKGRATGGVRVQRLLSGEAQLVLGWAGPAPAWAAGAGGDAVELPSAYGKRDGSGTPVEKAPTAVGRPHLPTG